MKVLAYTKSGGSWLAWMLADVLHKPNFFCDQVPKQRVDALIPKFETPAPHKVDVHLVRHPLDVACSAFNYLLLTNRATEEQAENFFLDYINSGGVISPLRKGVSWTTTVAWGQQNSRRQVLYNDLVDNTENVLTDLTGVQDVSESIAKYSLDNLRLREKNIERKNINRVSNPKYTFFNKADSFYYKEVMGNDLATLGENKFNKYIKLFWG